MQLNDLFDKYMLIREMAESTSENYKKMWNIHIRDGLGLMKVTQIKPSNIKALFSRLSKANYSRSTIKLLYNMIYPTLEMAVEDDIIRKNPAKGCMQEYGSLPRVKEALSKEQQDDLLKFVDSSNVYRVHLPLLQIMIGTALRAGELIGLTWNDVNLKEKTINIDHQLIYKNYGDGFKFHVKPPKTESGIRTLPMTDIVKKAFLKHREYQMLLGIDSSFEIEGLSDFIFKGRYGRPMMPSAINDILYNIVNAYNKEETIKAKNERRKVKLMPNISAHTLRHTGCTRMAECGIDPKVLQYLMGHSNIAITMEVYNHITDRERLDKEILKLNMREII